MLAACGVETILFRSEVGGVGMLAGQRFGCGGVRTPKPQSTSTIKPYTILFRPIHKISNVKYMLVLNSKNFETVNTFKT